MQKINVIEFIGSLSDGGAETLVKDYATLINHEKFNIEIVTIWDNGSSANSRLIKESGVKTHKIYPQWNIWIRIINKIFGRYYVSKRILSIVCQENISCIHVHLSQLKYILPISNNLKKLNVKIFYTCHNIPLKFFGENNNIEKKAAIKLIENNNMKIIALHDNMAKELNELFKINNTIVIHNGINLERFIECNTSYKEAKRKLGIPNNRVVIGHIGRFNIQKNHEFLIDIFIELKKKNSNFFLLMVGDGSLKNKCIEKLNNFVSEEDYLILSHRTDVPDILRSMDCFVFPSLYEGLGIVLVEAQASGLKCIVSNKVPKDAFLSDGIISLPIDQGVEIWTESILKSLNKKNISCDFCNYDMKKEIKILEEIYSK